MRFVKELPYCISYFNFAFNGTGAKRVAKGRSELIVRGALEQHRLSDLLAPRESARRQQIKSSVLLLSILCINYYLILAPNKEREAEA